MLGSAKLRWLAPLLAAKFARILHDRTGCASSDATNMQARRSLKATTSSQRSEVVEFGIGHPHCRLLIFMGLTELLPEIRASFHVLVPLATRSEDRTYGAGIWFL